MLFVTTFRSLSLLVSFLTLIVSVCCSTTTLQKLISYDAQDVENNIPVDSAVFQRKVAHYYPVAVKKESFEQDSYNYAGSSTPSSYSVPDTTISSGGYGTGGYATGKNPDEKKGKLKKIAVALLPLLLLLLLIPLGLAAMFCFSLPIFILTVPRDQNPPVWIGSVRSARSVHESEYCVERISCKIAKKAETRTKILMHWVAEKYSKHKLLQRIKKGFLHEDCSHFPCSLPIFDKY